MEKKPKTIKQILNDVKKDKSHSKEELISFLRDTICLYEDYDGLSDCLIYIVNELKNLTHTENKEYLPIVDIFSRLCKDKDSCLLEEQEELNSIENLFILNQEKYLQSNDDIAEITHIGKYAYYINEPVMHIVAEMLLNQLTGISDLKQNIGKQVLEQQNIGFFIEVLAERGNTFIVITDNTDKINYDVFCNMLFRLGHKIILLHQCDCAEEDVEYYLNLSQNYEDMTVIPYAKKVLWKLVHVCCEKLTNHFACLIGNGHILDLLSVQAERGCEVERLTSIVSPALEEKLTYGWAGDYLSYISRIYQFDAHKELEADTEYKFSIIIPAKDSAETLRYTLQTCIAQRWNGKYEIIVSDNSSEGNTSVYDLCKELNNERLRYYKTPRMLPIGRNFEYAFLRSRGEFLISIGSDDGLLPWTLEVLNEVLENNNDEILTWIRGHYQWPDYGKGISDYLDFPCGAEKGTYEVCYTDSVEYLKSVLNQTSCMYTLPLLYISSGFRRSYMKTLLNKTGRMWDGPCQDIFMGIINTVINEKICRINYPLSIAGMAKHSTGQKYTRLLDSIDKVNQRHKNGDLGEISYIGGWASSFVERMIPRITSDVGLCFNCFIRIVAKKILPFEFASKYFNYKRWYLELYNLMDKKEYVFERQIREMHYAALCNGPEFLKWFEETLYILAMRTEECPDTEGTETEDNTKTYQSGVTNDGIFFLDASKYGVTNIYEAVLLVEQISKY